MGKFCANGKYLYIDKDMVKYGMLFKQGREALHFSMDLSRVLGKKVGDFIKKESQSLINQGLEIPRDYYGKREEKFVK